VPLGGLVDRDVRTPEPIDGLLGVAHQEDLSRNRGRVAPGALLGIVGGEQQQDLGLQRIGVLELVDEEVGEARLIAAADRRIGDDEVARADQQVHEVEHARALLGRLVGVDHGTQLLAQAGREIGIGGLEHRIESGLGGVAARGPRRARRLRRTTCD
jgi:hypothetical protein